MAAVPAPRSPWNTPFQSARSVPSLLKDGSFRTWVTKSVAKDVTAPSFAWKPSVFSTLSINCAAFGCGAGAAAVFILDWRDLSHAEGEEMIARVWENGMT